MTFKRTRNVVMALGSTGPTAAERVRLVAVFFIAIGVFALLFIWSPLSFHCRHGGTCEVDEGGIFFKRHVSFPATALRGAEVATGPADKEGDPTYRVVLETGSGPVPLHSAFTINDPTLGYVAELNAFVHNPSAPEIVIRDDERINLYIAIGSLVAGILLWLCVRFNWVTA